MVIDVKDLIEGDEIIISAYSDLKYLRVLRTPVESTTKKHWKTGVPLYKAVKCSLRKDDYTHSSGYHYSKIVCSPEGHNKDVYQDLNGRVIWLVKRKY